MTPGQSRAARSWLRWSLTTAAKNAGISRTTVTRFESNISVVYASVDKLRRAYERAGIEFNGRIHVTYHHGDREEVRPRT